MTNGKRIDEEKRENNGTESVLTNGKRIDEEKRERKTLMKSGKSD